MRIPTIDLTQYFKLCSTVVSSREKDELIYRGVLIDGSNSNLRLYANGNFNIIDIILSDTQMERITQASTSPLNKSVVIEASKVLDILGKSTVDMVELQIAPKDEEALILKANGKNKIRYLSAEDMPESPEIDFKNKLGTININKMAFLLNLLKPFTSEDVHKQMLVGVCIADNTMFACDEVKSLTLRETGISFDEPLIIDIDLVDILKQVEELSGYEELEKEWNIYLTTDGAFMVFSHGVQDETSSAYINIYIHRYNSEYPIDILERANDIARANVNAMTFNIDDMLKALDRISIFVDAGENALAITVGHGKKSIYVETTNAKTGETGSEHVKAKIVMEEKDEAFKFPLSFSDFSNILSTFSNHYEELTFRFTGGEDSKFVSIHDDQYDAWVIKSLIRRDKK